MSAGVVHVDAGPILAHLAACPICHSYTATHEATGTRADFDGLCPTGAELLGQVDAAMRRAGYAPRDERGGDRPS